MKRFISFVVILTLLLTASFVLRVSADDSALLSQASQYWQEKSYSLAIPILIQLSENKNLSKESKDEINFKLADSQLKINQNAEKALKKLEEIIEQENKNEWYANANLSLAEYLSKNNSWQYRDKIIEYYQNARGYWAGSTKTEQARPKFINISFQLADFIQQNYGWYYNQVKLTSLNGLPNSKGCETNCGLDMIFLEILKVANNDDDKARAYYSIAMSLSNKANTDTEKKEVVDAFKKVINDYAKSDWTDDAYFYLAEFLSRFDQKAEALKYYSTLINIFSVGQSKWINDAKRRIENITKPEIRVNVGYTFLPESEIQFGLQWKNVRNSKVTIYKLDLVKELIFRAGIKTNDYDYGVDSYNKLLKDLVSTGQFRSLPIYKNIPLNLKNEGKYNYHGENKTLTEWLKDDKSENLIDKAATWLNSEQKEDEKSVKLEPGAYLIYASADNTESYDLILVTDLGFITKIGKSKSIFYAFDGKTGKPKANATVKYQYRYYDNNKYVWKEGQGVTDERGIFDADLKVDNDRRYEKQVFAVVSAGVMQAFAQSNYYPYSRNSGDWNLYAYADRPAYRPNEQVSFKGIVRKYDGKSYVNTFGQQIKAVIYDARGNKIKEGSYTLNAYGSFNDSLVLDEKASLGEYRIEIRDINNYNIGSAQLFRLEEYKLPEFQVSIKPKGKDDKQAALYKLGDEVEIEIDAQYYFGGAVAEAEVEYLVYQDNYYHYYKPNREFSWYYADMYRENNYSYGYGTLIKKELIKTDKQGKASFKFETLKESNNDLKYHIEARVVDQSRREITAASDIKVTKNMYYAYLTAQQNLYRPGDKAKIDVKTITANEEPISVEGKVTVFRNWWDQVAPIALKEEKSVASGVSRVNKNSEVIKDGEYSKNELFTKFVKTNAQGEVVFEFEPNENGYYTIEYTGFDTDGSEIKNQTNIFVCDKQATNIGYKYSGLQLISEKDTYDVGDIARFMIVTDNPDAFVLFSSEADDINDYDLFEMKGPVKLIEIPIKDEFTPNIYFTALSAQDFQLKTTNLQIIVPPKEKFLNVKIASDKETYSPQQEGVFDILLTDKDGNPVSAELSLGIVDKSIYYIQGEYVKDIREHYYGQKRNNAINLQSSFYQRRYMKILTKKEQEDQIDKLKVTKQGSKNDLVQNKVGFELGDGGTRDEFMLADSDSTMSKSVRGMAAPMMEAGEKKSEMERPASIVAKDKENAVLSESSAGELKKADVRTDFRSTVIWLPVVITDENGKATVKAKFPDSLTSWTTTARVVTPETRVGNITHEVKTKKDVLVRLQAPRFFTQRDKVVISANIHNYTDTKQNIKVTIDVKNLEITDKKELWIEVESQGEQRVDWNATAVNKGIATIMVMAQSSKDSDAMQKTYPIIEHGIEKFIANSIVVKSNTQDEIKKSLTINVPKERIKESTSLKLVLSPSIAANLLDALPYLVDYPYGCVEQTMSRFLPLVIVANTMNKLGLSEDQIGQYIEDVLNPSDDPAYPHMKGYETISKIQEIAKQGLNRLYDFQHSDGGWGWWKEDDSNRFMSAYVVWGLSLARDAGINVRNDVLSRGANFLQNQLVEEEDNPDMLAWMLNAISQSRYFSNYDSIQSNKLWEMRDSLNPYTRALYALSSLNRGENDKAQILARNLINGIKVDKDNETAHWGEVDSYFRFSEGEVEATAFVIKALADIDPKSEYLEPAVKWLTLNRRGSRWKNTKDTAIAILGLADYLKSTNELKPNYAFDIKINGRSVKSGKIDQNNLFTFLRNLELPDEALTEGENKIEVVLNGTGSLYVSAYLKYFTLEENITAAGNEVFVKRSYKKKAEKETLMKGYDTEWVELVDGDTLNSGDRIQVEIELESKNNYEYLVVEDYKPAGFEAVNLQSGSVYFEQIDEKKGKKNEFYRGKQTWAFREFRDQKVAFFITNLKQGKHKITYELRAEIPGEFHGMPNQVHAMYVPEIRANSSEARLNIVDK